MAWAAGPRPTLRATTGMARAAALARAARNAAGSLTVSRNKATTRVPGSSRAWSR
jgi:hypothetical protein